MRISDWSSDVCSSDLRRIAHANVERVDLKPDPRIPELSNLLGKGFILPAPILPRARFRSLALPTPMSTCQQNLPIALYAYDPEGREIGGRPLGKLPRNHATLVDLEDLLRSEEHTSELQSLMRISYAVFCLKKKKKTKKK